MVGKFLKRLGKAIRDQIVQEIPPELSYCEFECREINCPVKGWADCPQLLAHKKKMQRLEERAKVRAQILERETA